MEKNEINPIQNIIYEIRGQKVMLDSDLSKLYGVEAKRLNEAVKRNIKRFPNDFMFQLTNDEWSSFLKELSLWSQIATSKKKGGRRYAPFVFTEHGVSMLSSVINSERAIEVNINIMRVFINLRRYIYSQEKTNDQVRELRKLLMLHIENNDQKFYEHDEAIKHIIHALNNLIEKPKETRRIGFNTD